MHAGNYKYMGVANAMQCYEWLWYTCIGTACKQVNNIRTSVVQAV